LLLLLGDLLGRFRRLIDQGRSVIVFIALSDKGEPRAGHSEKRAFALGIGGLLGKPNTLSRVRSIFSGVWHTQPPDTSENILVNDHDRHFVPKSLGQWKIQIRTTPRN
jgi:hypothetical protein